MNKKSKKERTFDKHEFFVCDCGSLEHTVAFSYDEELDLMFMRPHLVTHRSFLQRLKYGLKYAFGYKSRFGAFDEIIFDRRMREDLRKMLKEKQLSQLKENNET